MAYSQWSVYSPYSSGIDMLSQNTRVGLMCIIPIHEISLSLLLEHACMMDPCNHISQAVWWLWSLLLICCFYNFCASQSICIGSLLGRVIHLILDGAWQWSAICRDAQRLQMALAISTRIFGSKSSVTCQGQRLQVVWLAFVISGVSGAISAQAQSWVAP